MLNFIKKLGPGLLFAGAAIGVSHIVQSTRAGALYSFELLWIILFANILKLPILELGVRYPMKKKKSLLYGYKDLSNYHLYFFIILTILTMFIIQAAISVVTAGIVLIFFPKSISILVMSFIVLSLAGLLLYVGKYSFLDNFVKWIVITLTLTCVIVFFLSFQSFEIEKSSFFFSEFNFESHVDILFMMALIGWMPAPVETSVWQSLWYEEKKDFQNSFFDFHIGYWTTTILAILFLSLGAMIMFSSGKIFSAKSVSFASELVQLFTFSIGDWAKPIIAFACLATMVSTTITCLDAYPRVLANSFKILKKDSKDYYKEILLLTVIGTSLVLFLFLRNMKQMVDFATIISFLVTPIIGYFNFKIFKTLRNKSLYDRILYGLYIISLGFFSCFTLYFLYLKTI